MTNATISIDAEVLHDLLRAVDSLLEWRESAVAAKAESPDAKTKALMARVEALLPALEARLAAEFREEFSRR